MKRTENCVCIIGKLELHRTKTSNCRLALSFYYLCAIMFHDMDILSINQSVSGVNILFLSPYFPKCFLLFFPPAMKLLKICFLSGTTYTITLAQRLRLRHRYSKRDPDRQTNRQT